MFAIGMFLLNSMFGRIFAPQYTGTFGSESIISTIMALIIAFYIGRRHMSATDKNKINKKT